MANSGVFQQYSILSQLPFSHTPSLLPSKTHHSFSSIQLPKHRLLYLHVKTRIGSSVFVSKTPAKGETDLLERESFDFDDEFDEDFEEEEDEDDVEDEFIGNMKEWRRNKPRGFGEGKVYDTSIEDKLMEEMEQSRRAQLANLNKLKNSSKANNSSSKKENLQKQKASEVVPSRTRVRLVKLPKKKNIHRDLQAAFKEVSGIISISPAVSGNKKTRDPVCKGFAFVDFSSEKDANRFMEVFSGESITFGKIQKQIKCEILKSSSSIPKPVARTQNLPLLPYASLEMKLNPVLDSRNSSVDSFVEGTAFDDYKNGNDGHVSASEDNEESLGNLNSSAPSGEGDSGEVAQVKLESATGSETSKKQKKDGEKGKKIKAKRKGEKTPKVNIPGSVDSFVEGTAFDDYKNGNDGHVSASEDNEESLGNLNSSAPSGEGDSGEVAQVKLESATGSETSKKQKKKIKARRKGEKTPKLNIPGSAKRLRVKEKSMLSNVFSRYGANSSSASKGPS